MDVRGLLLDGAWSPRETRLLETMLSPLPRAWLEENPCLLMLVRRPVLREAPPEAPGHSKYDAGQAAIVVYDKGVYHDGRLDPEQFRRSVYHELGHAIIECDKALLQRWTTETAGDKFVDEYAKTSPAEDFCDTFSEFLIYPQKTQQVVPRKWHFLYNLMQRPQEKIAMNFLPAFANELTKVAASSGAMHGLMGLVGRAMHSKAAKGLAVGGVGALAGGALGLAGGKRAGYSQGTNDVTDVAQKALQIGRQQGAQIGYQYAMQQLKGGQGK